MTSQPGETGFSGWSDMPSGPSQAPFLGLEASWEHAGGHLSKSSWRMKWWKGMLGLFTGLFHWQVSPWQVQLCCPELWFHYGSTANLCHTTAGQPPSRQRNLTDSQSVMTQNQPVRLCGFVSVQHLSLQISAWLQCLITVASSWRICATLLLVNTSSFCYFIINVGTFI